jgi:hypothetical protein
MFDVASWTHQAAPTMPTLISGVFPVGTSSEFGVVNPANKASSPTGQTPRAAPARAGLSQEAAAQIFVASGDVKS